MRARHVCARDRYVQVQRGLRGRALRHDGRAHHDTDRRAVQRKPKCGSVRQPCYRKPDRSSHGCANDGAADGSLFEPDKQPVHIAVVATDCEPNRNPVREPD